MFVCMCAAVTEAEIRLCIRSGASTVDEVGDVSFAGTGCGGCHETIAMILDDKAALTSDPLFGLPNTA